MKPKEKKSQPIPSPQGRLSREDWLRQALEILSTEGEGKLRIDAICRALGVTKGSFYWHFKSRSDFLQAIFDYWMETYNQSVPQAATMSGGTAADQIRSVFEMATRENLGRFDVAFDAWAAHEPGIADQVRKAYRVRYDYVSGLFRKLGFRGVELEVRTVAFLAFLKVESRVTGKPLPKRNARRIATELEFFLRPL